MAKLSPKTVPYRRAREQKTNYKKRLALLLSGKPRLVARLTNSRLIGQLVQFSPAGDKVLAAVDSFSLRKLGWSGSAHNLPAAYLTGLLLGRKGAEKNCLEAVFDTGFRQPCPRGRLYAFLQGVVEGGIKVTCGEGMFPVLDRLQGKHLKSKSGAEFLSVQQKIRPPK